MSLKTKIVCEICGREYAVDSPLVLGFNRFGYHTVANRIELAEATKAHQHICRDCVFNLALAMFARPDWKLGDAVCIFR